MALSIKPEWSIGRIDILLIEALKKIKLYISWLHFISLRSVLIYMPNKNQENDLKHE